MNNTKKNNARIEKWRAMINQGVFQNRQLLNSRIRKGIPPAVRMLAWPEIVKLQKFIESKKAQYKYEKLINSFSNNIYEITLDIPRTFPEEEDSKVLRKSLNNVLKAISIIYPKVGYCQGMNFLVLRLLQVMEDEETFWLMHYLFQNDQHLMKNFIDPKLIESENYVFVNLLRVYLPAVYQTFQDQNVVLQSYTVKWFITLFSSTVSQELFNRIFEVYLNQGWTIIYAVGLTFFRLNQDKIVGKKMEKIHLTINSQIYHILDISAFMEEVYKMELKTEEILFYSKQFEKTQLEKKDLKESQIKKHHQINSRELENKQAIGRRPQSENIKQVIFQNKSQELNFDVFEELDKPV